MIRFLLWLPLLGCAIPAAQTVAPIDLAAPMLAAPRGFIHRDGRHLADGEGQAIRLRGPALGGWLTWEGWMWGASWQSESQLMAALSKRVGASDAEQFRADIYRAFITADDFAQMRALGFNNVKLPVNHRVLEDDAAPFVYKSEGWALLDGVLEAAEQQGIHVAIDLHAAPCGQMRAFAVDPGTDSDPNAILWDDAQCQERTVQWWKAVAARYQNRTIVSAYVLMGEPFPNRCSGGPTAGKYCGPTDSCGLGGSCDVQGRELLSLHQRIVEAIRSVDANHLIVLEGARYSQDFSMCTGRLDDNAAYGPHDYLFDGGDPKALLEGWKAIAARDEMPLWIGEMGLSAKHSDTSAQVRLYDGDPSVSGWAYWSWKITPSYTFVEPFRASNNYLMGIRTTPRWEALMAWVVDPTFRAQPSPDDARGAMADFLESVRIENNLFDPETVRTLER